MSALRLTGTSHGREKEVGTELKTGIEIGIEIGIETVNEIVNGTATGTERRIDPETRAETEIGTARRTAIATEIGIEIDHESATDEIALRPETIPPAHGSVTRKTLRSESSGLSSSARRKLRNTSLSRRKPGRKVSLFQASVTAHFLTNPSRMTVHDLTRIDTYPVFVTIGTDDGPADLAVATVIETETGTGTGTENEKEKGTETETETGIGIGRVSGIETGSVKGIARGIRTGTGREIARGTGIETGTTGLATDTGTEIMTGTARGTVIGTDVVRGAYPHAANDATVVAAVDEVAVIEGGVAANRHTSGTKQGASGTSATG